MEKKFSKKEAIQFGWQVMKNNFWFFVGILIVVGLVASVPNISERLIEKSESISLIIILYGINFLVTIFNIIIAIGLFRIALKFCDDEKAKFSDLFSSSYRLFFRYIFSGLLYNLIVLAGFILLIIPGIIWAIKFQFFGYLIVDKGLGPIEALKKSALITKGAKWNLFIFGLLMTGINLLGALCLLVGLFVTVPTTMIATAFVYRRLLAQVETTQMRE